MAWVEKKQTSAGKTRYLVSWRDPDTGRKVRRSVRTERAARGLKAEVEVEIDRGTYVSPSAGEVTVGEFWEELISSAWNLRPHVVTHQRGMAGKWIIPFIGHMPLRNVQTSTLRLLLADVSSPGSREAVYALLKRIFRAAHAEGKIVRDPMVPIPRPKHRPRDARFLTHIEVDLLADAVPARYRALVLVAAYGGLRLGEALALSDVDFNPELGTLNVHKTLVVDHNLPEGQRVHVSETKTRASRRIVDIPEHLVVALQGHLGRFGDGPAIFTAPDGSLVHRSSFGSMWRRVMSETGFEGVRFHDLRHTHAAWCIQAGAHPKEIQARLGHASISVTMDTYGHLFPGSGKKLAERLSRPQEDVSQ